MKTIYLIRHAKSSWKDADSQADWERPLNERGRRDAPFMGKLLEFNDLFPDAILSSHATRAHKTAKIIAEELGFSKKDIIIRKEIYEASPATILELIQKLDDKWKVVLIFGHNPTFTEIANWYSEATIENLPTCGIAGIEFNIRHWVEATPTNGNLFLFDYPKRHLPNNDALED